MLLASYEEPCGLPNAAMTYITTLYMYDHSSATRTKQMEVLVHSLRHFLELVHKEFASCVPADKTDVTDGLSVSCLESTLLESP